METKVKYPYSFDPLTRILRKGDFIVKNCWPNTEPSQQEIDSVIAVMEEAADMLKGC